MPLQDTDPTPSFGGFGVKSAGVDQQRVVPLSERGKELTRDISGRTGHQNLFNCHAGIPFCLHQDRICDGQSSTSRIHYARWLDHPHVPDVHLHEGLTVGDVAASLVEWPSIRIVVYRYLRDATEPSSALKKAQYARANPLPPERGLHRHSPDLGLAGRQAVYAPLISRLGHKLVSGTQTKGPSWRSAEWHLRP